MRARWMAGGAIGGGTLWIVKSGAMVAGGDQPPLAFELAPVFFAISALAYTATWPQRSVAMFALVAAALAFVLFVLDRPGAGGPLLGVSMLGVIVVLVWRGWVARRASWIPVALGVATVPLVAAGGMLSLLDERLLEVPILLLGLAWVLWGGHVLWARKKGSLSSATSAPP